MYLPLHDQLKDCHLELVVAEEYPGNFEEID